MLLDPNSDLQGSYRFQEPYNVKYFKVIKRFKGVQKAGAYLEIKRESMMELLCEYTEQITIFAIKALSMFN